MWSERARGGNSALKSLIIKMRRPDAKASTPPRMKTKGAAAIKHVVLLLMENRPFDHFFGFAQPFLPNKIDGLTGKECFPTHGGGLVEPKTVHAATADPDHPLDTKIQIMYNTFGHEDKYVSFADTVVVVILCAALAQALDRFPGLIRTTTCARGPAPRRPRAAAPPAPRLRRPPAR